ncbi:MULTISPECIES: formate dehydrogenase accessory protein FdhE [unclassified Mesorhizobium]|uniref:formate dehydrogenase accessory protein FdhE n=1 Tax=unclassified Mesorhizobium TaxID=325217 RepID=UPI000FC9FB38|nr:MULTISPECIES: formate dehydrogenase accessory protein FdhE [unclassified Mesorhizobium]RUW35528.1 formate dehydrogenase accessory protein FdhE [Mesorhizobium sp. M1E.F.Ca.ET.041.01.1.1]RWD91683.1 MAG: formate dehydrogenase accessory protein FdhE [Mesorhizobium sp.]RWD92946.1 MAG: formate dehydrogenase accessory protein FdhE [Mesorhizobium sp.]TIV55708.1 MAG: formate dehydrogenase accessory protein FdhE [Mesorhizobium sp.]
MPRQIIPAGSDPTAIGEVSAPPFARLPEPSLLFSRRAERWNALAAGHELGPYLRFLAALADVQHRIQEGLAEPEMPDVAVRERARSFGMPPLDRSNLAFDTIAETLDRLVVAASEIKKPVFAADALDRLKQATPAKRGGMVRNVLANAIPMEALAEHVYVSAALQVNFARLAARLDARALVAVGDGACPACGSPPTSSIIVGWQGAHGARFCACSLCSTLWNYVRIKCTLCGSTKGIGYQEIDGGSGTVKAETCDSCSCYVKILHQHQDPGLDPVADDVATLGLDILVREGGYRRGSFNPFLIGY